MGRKTTTSHNAANVGGSVYIKNDCEMVGLGEAIYGAGREKEIVGYITFSTGIGGAKIINGKIGPTHYAFEPGYMLIPSKEGEVDYFERLVSGSAIRGKYGEIGKDMDPNIENEIIKIMVIGLNNISVLWSPDVIVLGGSIPHFLNVSKIEEELKNHLKIYPEIPEIKLATLGKEGGLYGGLALLQRLP